MCADSFLCQITACFKMALIYLGSVAEAKLQAVKDWESSSSFVSLSLKIYLRVQ